MITADDLRDALIYGINDARAQCMQDTADIHRYVQDGNLSPDNAYVQLVAAAAVQKALDALIDRLTGDWPPTRG